MITIGSEKIRDRKNFWNNCLFHPTDAVEDAWGRRILDRMAKDGAIQTVRIYAMLEDIVYLDGDGTLAYDFRLSDLRLDYLIEKGYDLLIAYGMMPECIATNKNATSSVSKNKTRYKGKLINTSAPLDYALWEEICHTYTAHLVERYGIETVSGWHLQCFNEPDIRFFFLSDLPDDEAGLKIRAQEYCKLYRAFAKGVKSVSKRLRIGGPALAHRLPFLEDFLGYVKENRLPLDFISYHNYGGTGVWRLCNEYCGFNVGNWVHVHEETLAVIQKCGFDNTEMIIDEWGMSGQGFYNIEECPYFIARETEVFSAYFVKLVATIIEKGWHISKLMLCLSGQHEMVTDFSGFRNFFTLNFFAKPIYNAHVLGAKLHRGLLAAQCENKNVFVIPTKNENGDYAVLLTYCAEKFEEDLPEVWEELVFDGNIEGKTAIVYCIDRENTNPFRLYERMGLSPALSEEEIRLLRGEGTLRPIASSPASRSIKLKLTANAVYLIEIK